MTFECQVTACQIRSSLSSWLLAICKLLPGEHVKRYKDSLGANLKKCGFQPKALCEEQQDRDSWRSQGKEAIAKFEEPIMC